MKFIGVFPKTCNTRLCSFISNGKSKEIVMASETYNKYLENINKHLTSFEKEPKVIEGNLIRKWFNIGESLFNEFYFLGNSLQWNLSKMKNKQAEVSDIVSGISKNQGWLQTFISIYPGLRIDLDGATPAVDVCRVRSGIEFLVQGFAKINRDFDNVLDNLKKLGELQEFDEHLKIWKDGHRPTFFSRDLHTDTPKSHWWWF